MSVCIRLSRYGRVHRPYFRVVAIDKRCHREGMSNEIVGFYDPNLGDKSLQVNMERVNEWVGRGARISTSLTNLLKFYDYTVPAKKVAEKKAAGKKAAPKPTPKKTYVAPSRRALNNHKAKLKAVAKAENEKKKAAHAAAKAAKAAEAKPAEAAPEAPKA